MKRVVVDRCRRAANSWPVRTVTSVTGLQGRFHRLYWRWRFRANGGTCSRQVNGSSMEFHAGTPEEFRHCWTLMGERDVIEDVVAHVEPGDVFYDVGAYLGVYTAAVGANRPTARSLAFEPDPGKHDRLRRNLAVNDLSAEHQPYVLADETGTVSFATSGGADGPNVSRVATNGYEGAVEVEQTTVDALVERGTVPLPNVVKIDVEGGEVDVLRGMRNTLGLDACRAVFCEVHPTLLPDYGASTEDIRELLSGAGFDVTHIEERGEEYFLRATRPSR